MKHFRRKIFLILAIFLAILVYSLLRQNTPGLEVSFFSVGQGDAIFIETPSGKQILIDGGPSQKVLEKLGSAMDLTDNYIDLVILTHPHDDHVQGLVPVLERYQVGELIYNGTAAANQNYEYLLKTAKNKGIPTIIANQPSTINLEENCALRIIYPLTDLSGQSLKKINDGSIATRLDCAGHSFLFMGDLEKKGESELLLTDIDLRAEFLKLGHHGSYTASSLGFLEAVSPNLAIISVGLDNSYNLPATSTLESLNNLGIDYWRTDKQGDLIIEVRNGQLTQKSQ
ncbi:MAG TPA: MBL fold metallo-hydrolase [bacterium]|nr:MBL fold metallo-hydrolase [bacterium]HPT29396.1 MBL fold metallo-hydrolase [bacterium]